jgi:hypothetical protein
MNQKKKKKKKTDEEKKVEREHCSTSTLLKTFNSKKGRRREERPTMETNDPTLSNKTSTLLPSVSTWPALYRSYFGMN